LPFFEDEKRIFIGFFGFFRFEKQKSRAADSSISAYRKIST